MPLPLGWAPRFVLAGPSETLARHRRSSLRLRPPSEYRATSPTAHRAEASSRWILPWGFVPYSVFPESSSPIEVSRPRPLRLQVFATSWRLLPLDPCRSCFIPVPLLGFALQSLAPRHTVVRRLRRRAPLVVGYHARIPPGHPHARLAADTTRDPQWVGTATPPSGVSTVWESGTPRSGLGCARP
jgi:hypothetical protein